MAITCCPGCGIELPSIDGPVHRYIESSAACWACYGEVLAREYSDSQYRRAHRLTVDAYAVQHPGRPGPRSTQSVCARLISLFAVVEKNLSHEEATLLIGRIVNRNHFFWLEPPEQAGSVTVESVYAASNPEEHLKAVERWARSVWDAWEEHHLTIKAWAGNVGVA